MKKQIGIEEYLKEQDKSEKQLIRIWHKDIGPALPYDARYEEMKKMWVSGASMAQMIRR